MTFRWTPKAREIQGQIQHQGSIVEDSVTAMHLVIGIFICMDPVLWPSLLSILKLGGLFKLDFILLAKSAHFRISYSFL